MFNFRIHKLLLFILFLGVFSVIPFQKIFAQGPIQDYRSYSEQEILAGQIDYQVREMEKLPSQIDSDQSLWTRVTGGVFSTTNDEIDEQFFYTDRKLLELAKKIPQTNLSAEQEKEISALLQRADEARIEYLKARQKAIDNGYTFQSSVGTTLENLYAMNRYQELILADPDERETAPPEGYDPEGRANIAGEAAEQNASELSAKEEENSHQCVYWFGINPWQCVLELMAGVANLLLKLFGVVLWLSSLTFDLAVYSSIVGFKSLIETSTVDAVWRVMRDLANLTFIFILLYIAIGVIFDLQSIGSNAKKMIVNVIIIALLVNFSGFIVRIVVDASNVVAYEFYSRMSYDPQAQSGLLGKVKANIGTALVSKLNLGAHVVPLDEASDTLPAEKTTRLGFMQIILGTIGGVVIILMASFVLLAASIMFMIRMVVLLLVYVLSPLALVSMLIPQTKDLYTRWKKALINQSFYAPAFLIPLFGVFAILGTQGLSTLVGGFGVGSGMVALTLVQLIVMGLIASCIFIAQRFSATGVDFAQKWSGKTNATVVKYGTSGLSLGGKLIRKGAVKAREGAESSYAKNPTGQATRLLKGATWTAERITAIPGGTAKTYDAGKKMATETKKYLAEKLDFRGPSLPKPLLSINDYVSSSVGKVNLGKNFNILGTDKEARRKFKDDKKSKEKEEKEEKEEKRKIELKEKIEKLKIADVTESETIIDEMLDKDIKDLPAEVLTRNEVCPLLTQTNLKEILEVGNLTRAEKGKIKTAISKNPGAKGYIYMTTGAGTTDWI